MNWILWLVLGVVALMVVGALWLRLRAKRPMVTAEERVEVTVQDILTKVEAKVKEELKPLTPQERIQRWNDLYGD